ncbi:MAG TPA: hypothetical protein VD861_15285 [Pyrinomonadaceae bacterium]|nr:hypothetical protein [Pyrinomonadaceae bacterium]
MTANTRSRNRALVRYILLPMIFLTVALLGGLRIDVETKAFLFYPPPLITLIFSVMVMLLFVRGRAVEIRAWLGSDLPALTNVSHALTLVTLYFATAQAFNTVLPERGLLKALFCFFFAWTLWNNYFSKFDVRSLLLSMAVLFGTAFFLKHMFLASLFAPGGGWAKKIAGFFLEVGTLGTIDSQTFAPATGYISFFTLLLYVAGLVLLTPRPEPEEDARALVRSYRDLPPLEQMAVREAIAGPQPSAALEAREPQKRLDTVEVTGELVTDMPSEETLVTRKPDA